MGRNQRTPRQESLRSLPQLPPSPRRRKLPQSQSAAFEQLTSQGSAPEVQLSGSGVQEKEHKRDMSGLGTDVHLFLRRWKGGLTEVPSLHDDDGQIRDDLILGMNFERLQGCDSEPLRHFRRDFVLPEIGIAYPKQGGGGGRMSEQETSDAFRRLCKPRETKREGGGRDRRDVWGATHS